MHSRLYRELAQNDTADYYAARLRGLCGHRFKTWVKESQGLTVAMSEKPRLLLFGEFYTLNRNAVGTNHGK